MDTEKLKNRDNINTVNLKTILISQYCSCLAMLRHTIENCPESLWLSDDHRNRFWHIAYHALFYTHLYAQVDEKAFSPWEKQRENCQYMGALPLPPHDKPNIGKPYSREDVLEYLDLCETNIADWVDKLALPGSECGFWWYNMSKLEHQFNNLRHIQHHVGQLADRLRKTEDVGTDWVGKG